MDKLTDSSVLPSFANVAYPHPRDERIWYSDDPKDLENASHPEVKAVIWTREAPNYLVEARRAIQETCKKDDHKNSSYNEYARYDSQKPYIEEYYIKLRTIAREVAFQDYQLLFNEILNPERNFLNTRSGRIDEMHIDVSASTRFLCAVVGSGTKFYAGLLPEKMLARYEEDKTFGRYSDHDFDCSDTGVMDVVPKNSIIAFKGRGLSKHGIDPRKVLFHKAPSEPRNAQRIAYLLQFGSSMPKIG